MQTQHSLKELGPNVNTSDPTLWLLRQEYHKFKANLGKTLSQKKRDLEARAPVSGTAWFAGVRAGLFGDAIKKEGGLGIQTHEQQASPAKKHLEMSSNAVHVNMLYRESHNAFAVV